MLNNLQPLTAPFLRLHDLCDANEGFLKKYIKKRRKIKAHSLRNNSSVTSRFNVCITEQLREFSWSWCLFRNVQRYQTMGEGKTVREEHSATDVCFLFSFTCLFLLFLFSAWGIQRGTSRFQLSGFRTYSNIFPMVALVFQQAKKTCSFRPIWKISPLV